ncbi:MAG: nicotinate (nicotinamide) nucleotide adenylyltransferase [Muribaculaceae bacterium]
MNIAVFGGTFNPIHIGHAILTNYIVENTHIDSVWLMVARQNPLKEGYDKSYDIHRLRMTEMVSSRLQGVITSGFEFSLPYPSYTINTLDALAEKFPEHHFSIVIGADNWAMFGKWKDWERIIAEYGVMVYPRRGYDIVIPEEYAGQVMAIDAPMIEVSSTYIRESIAHGKDMTFFLPHDVYHYIKRNGLYIRNEEKSK